MWSCILFPVSFNRCDRIQKGNVGSRPNLMKTVRHVIPRKKEVVDGCWEQIFSFQGKLWAVTAGLWRGFHGAYLFLTYQLQALNMCLSVCQHASITWFKKNRFSRSCQDGKKQSCHSAIFELYSGLNYITGRYTNNMCFSLFLSLETRTEWRRESLEGRSG